MINEIIYKIDGIKLRLCSEKTRQKILKKRGVKIGENCVIFKNAKFGSEPYLVSMGNNVRITSNVQFITHDGGMWVLRNLYKLNNADKFGRIDIGNTVHIGWNVTIMPGVSIGDNCIIGVGAVVTKDIPDNSIAVGVPAKVIQSIDEYYLKNRDKVVYTKQLNRFEKKNFLLNNKNL